MGSTAPIRLGVILFVVIACTGSALAAPAGTPVTPESGTLALFGSGLIGLATLIRHHFPE